MDTFRTRIRSASGRGGKIILACDYAGSDLAGRATGMIESLHPFLCGIKLNFHLLLPLGASEIRRITGAAHGRGLEVMADIKLNDITSTNLAAARILWDMGVDCIIANPVMGPGALENLVSFAHESGRGVVSLCHMSAPEARESYELDAGGKKVYEMFLEWALRSGADGVIAGATYPDIVRYCAKEARGRLDVFSPGVGFQGGSAQESADAGTDYIISGRSIIESPDPARAARSLL